jgi:hypothetical protein
MPRPVERDKCSDINTDRQTVPALFGIPAQGGKPWLSVKPTPVDRELYLSP